MYITKAVLEDFGKFHNKELLLQPGLNLIYGANEAGKSTIKDFLVDMLYGIDKSRGVAAKSDEYAMKKPYDRPGFSGRLEVYAGGRAYQICRVFLRSEKETVVTDMETGQPISLHAPHSLLGTVLSVDKTTYKNTLCIGSSGAATEQALTELLKNKMINMSTSRAMEVDAAKAVALLKDKKKLFATRELEKELRRLSGEQDGTEELEKQLLALSQEYNALNEQLLKLQQSQTENLSELYHVEPKKTTEKSSVIFLVTALLLAALCAGIYFLPVSIQAKTIFWAGSFIGVLYILISSFAQKGRFVRSRKKRQRELQHAYEERDKKEREEIRQYTERLSYLRAKEEQLLEERRKQEEKQAHYDRLRAQLAAMEKEQKAIDLAIATIEQLSSAIYEGFGGSLNRRVSKIMEQITQGKYRQVFLSENMDFQVLDQGQYVALPYLSTGTKEQLYFSLRMAAAQMLECPSMPLLLDDVFLTYDEDRLSQVLTYLADYRENQIIFFTGDARIPDLFDEIGRDYNYICL